MLHKSFKSAKCKTALNLAKARVKIMKNKKDIQMKQLRREIAQLLQNNQDQTARIRVEHVVREEKMLAAYEMIEIFCELVVARLPIIESQKVCPLDLKEAITSLIFATPRCGDIPELQDVRKHFTAKYGKEFVAAAIELRPSCGVSRTMVEKLSVKAPDGPTKVKILKGIAEEHNIQWEANWFKDEEPVTSVEIPKKSYTDNDNTIQMEPLNVQIADDFEEKHAVKTSGISSQGHIPAKYNESRPSSTSRPDFRPAENVSVGTSFSPNSRTTENLIPTDKQHKNMRFKDATAAARAAAESAELASMAARAAAELSIRESSHEPGRSSEHANVFRHKHEQETPVNSSFNQRSPRLQGQQGYTDKQSDMSESELNDDRSSKKEFNQTGVQYEARQQEFRESKSPYRVNADSLSQSSDHVSIPSASDGDSNSSNSLNVQDYETEPDENPFHGDTVELQNENPFHGDTVEPQNQPSKVNSQSNSFGDEYGVFSNSHYQSDEVDSYNTFGAFGQGTSEQEDWHSKTTYTSKSDNNKDETIKRDYGVRNVFQESDEKKYGVESGSGVSVGTDQVFSGLGVDKNIGHNVATAVFDESGSDDDDEYVLVDAEEKHKSPSGKLSSRNSFFQQDNLHLEPDFTESFRQSSIYAKLLEPVPAFDDYDEPSPRSVKGLQRENSISDSRGSTDFIRPSSVGGIGYPEENQSTYTGTVNNGMGSESPRTFRIPSESKDHAPVFDNPSSESGVELNLGSVPGGRRNRPTLQPPYTIGDSSAVSSPSRFSKTASEDFGTHENKERSYSGNIHENMRGPKAKEPVMYFESDGSASEEDVPKPAVTKNLPSSGISRRTKGSTKLVSSRLSSNPDDTTKTGHFSSNSSYATGESPKRQTKTTSSSSRSVEPNLNDHAALERRPETKVSRKNEIFSTPPVEKPVTPTTAETGRATVSIEKAPSRENSGKNPSHVHPKLPDFETFTAHLQSLRTKRQ